MEVLTEEVASQQQTLAVAEGSLQDMTVKCKQCEVTFVFTKGEQRFFQTKKMTQPARCLECRKWISEKRAKTASKNRFQDSPSGPKFKTAIVAWAMCEGWWTEARNADGGSGMQARRTKQRKLGHLRILGRLKARGHARMAKCVQDILLGKNGKPKDFSSLSSWMQWQGQWSLESC